MCSPAGSSASHGQGLSFMHLVSLVPSAIGKQVVGTLVN